MQPVVVVCGVPGCGKSWACRQVADKFNYIPHDRCWAHPSGRKPAEGLDPKWGPKGSRSTHLETIEQAAKESDKPVLTECPFAERELKEQLEHRGVKVTLVFVVEHPRIVASRYRLREKKQIPKAFFSRASSVERHAQKWGAFHGTSTQVLEHLKEM